MSVLFYGPVIFFAAFCVHIVVWKFCVPRRQTNVLLLIFAAVFAIGLVVIKLLMAAGTLRVSIYEYLRFALFYTAAALAYIISYSAIEADSPTLLITLKIAQAGSAGLLKEDLYGSLSDDHLLIPRLKDLVRDGLATFINNRYGLTVKGSLFVGIFIFYRNVLGRQKGG